MATSRERFALDWIQGELMDTLNSARSGLESYAEALDADGNGPAHAGADELRECVDALHQVHGTLVMLELKGVTLLADHLERVAARIMDGGVADVAAASQILMQGILELPAYLEELQSGLPDSETSMIPMINELRRHLGEPALEAAGSGINLHRVADDAAIRRFDAIDGIGKTRKIRAVYQQVLLTVLKGGDLRAAVETLRKVAHGMARICEGTPFAAEWQAFGEFVESLALAPAEASALDGSAVKLLRRVDSEIREIARSGAKALQRPVSISVVRQLVEAAVERGRTSALLDELRTVAAQGGQSDALSLSGRQAMVSAASALREELGTIKDRLDLFVRGGGADGHQLAELLAPLKQIASTLSLLGFESSKSIVHDQVEALASLVDSSSLDEAAIENVAGALLQVDENLASLTQSGKGEVEQITGEAQKAVAGQAREGLEQVKQCIVDYVSAQWDVRHLQQAPEQMDAIVGALRMIPLTQAADLLGHCREYLSGGLMRGRVPPWEELDCLADILSGIDYYLERLASDKPSGAGDVLDLVERSLDRLPIGEPVALDGAVPRVGRPSPSSAAAPHPAPESESVPAAPFDAEPAAEESAEPATSLTEDATVEHDLAPVDAALFGSEEPVDLSRPGADGEPPLRLEADEDFDLTSPLFDPISDQPPSEHTAHEAQPAACEGEPPELVPEEPAAPARVTDHADEWQIQLDEEEPADLEATERPPEGTPGAAAASVDAAGPDTADALDEALDAFISDTSRGSEAARADAPFTHEVESAPAEVGTAAAPTSAAAPEAPPAAEPPSGLDTSTLADVFESDDEIVEIFVEEVDEVLASVDEHLDAWAWSLADEAHLGEIRRAFHTLKGSGRMVGANVLGEVAWSLENMLNRVMDGTVTPTPEFVTVVREARTLTPRLKDAFERKTAPDMTAVGRVMEQADLLASGGSLDEAGLTSAGGDGAARADAPEPAAPTADAEGQFSGDAALDEERQLFVGEAESHLSSLQGARREGGFLLTDEVMRALHTLSGSAAMAGADQVGDLASPTYELAQALRRPGAGAELTGEAAEFFREAAAALADMVDAMRLGREPEEAFQLIADADRLLAGLEQEDSGTASGLLALPAVNVLIGAGELLDAWRRDGMDLARADEVREALAELERAARAEHQPAVTALAGALLSAHECFEFEALSEPAWRVFREAHEALLNQLDALATDQTPTAADDLCATLEGLRPSPEETEATEETPRSETSEETEDDEFLLDGAGRR